MPLEWTPDVLTRFWQNEPPENYFTNYSGHRVARKLKRFLRGHRRVLDFGCGQGFFVKHLAELGLSVTATDVTPSSIADTNQRNANVPGFQGAFPVNEIAEMFDAIVSVEVVEHLTDEALEDYLATMWRLLEPGGTAIVTTPNAEDLSRNQVYCPCCDKTFHRWQHSPRLLPPKCAGTAFASPGRDAALSRGRPDYVYSPTWLSLSCKSFCIASNRHLAKSGSMAMALRAWARVVAMAFWNASLRTNSGSDDQPGNWLYFRKTHAKTYATPAPLEGDAWLESVGFLRVLRLATASVDHIGHTDLVRFLAQVRRQILVDGLNICGSLVLL